MRKVVGFIVFVMVFATAFAQTNVPGGDITTTTWDVAGSPYIVQGDVALQNGQVLTIDGGVTIQFEDEYKFEIWGEIITDSDENNWITFTNSGVNGWNGLRFANQPQGRIFHYVIIENAIHNENNYSGGGIHLDNCHFTMNHVLVQGCESKRYGGGIYMRESNPILEGVHIDNCTAAWDGGGMFLFNSSPNLKHNLITNNTAMWSGGGLAAFNGSSPIINKTTISDNSAMQDGPAIAALYNSNLSIVNTIVYRNYYGEYINSFPEIHKASSAIVNATYSLLRNGAGQSYFGTGCIDTNPLFDVNGITGYELTTESPCIDAGDPAPQYNDPDGTRADMGRFYYEQTGLRGSVALGTNVSPDLTFEDVSIIIYQGHSDANPIAELELNENGRFYMELASGGNYRVRCLVDFAYHSASNTDGNADYHDAVAIEGQLVNIDPNVNTARFEVNQLDPAHINGRVRISGLNLNNPLHNSIVISTSASDATTSPYPIYDIFGNVIEWRYEIDVPADNVWEITISLSSYSSITYTIGPYPSNHTHNPDFDEPVWVLEPVPFFGEVSGTITLKPDAGFTLPNITDVIVYWGDNIDSAVHPDADGNYLLQYVQNGYRSVTVDHPQLAKVTRDNIYIIANNETEGVDFVMLPWVPESGNQYVMTAYVTTTLDADFMHRSGSNVIGAFGPDGSCRGVGIWVEGNHPLWCNDIYYYGLPGYWYFTIVSSQNLGEFITFRGYDTETDEIYSFNNASMLFVDDTHNNHINLVDNSTSFDFSYNLNDDWNWISLNMYLDNYSTDVVLDGLIPNVQSIKNQDGSHTYYPPWLGDLPTLSNFESYKMNMHAADILSINGKKINPIIHPVFLDYPTVGEPDYWWHWISYLNPNNDTLPLDIALESIQGNVVSIKSQSQSAINDGGWIGDLTHLEVGKGYLVDIDGEVWLSYPGIGYYESKQHGTPYKPVNPAKWDLVSGNTTNMVLLADLGVSEKYQAGVFDVDGNCRSIGKYENGFWFFTVLGDEVSEELFIQLYDIDNGTTQISKDTFLFVANTLEGSVKNPVVFEFDIEDVPVFTTAKLNQNYPNPFNPITTFSYSIPTEGNVKLQVFNVKGQLVDTVVDQVQSPNHYEVTWDATEYGTGIYFYRLSVDGRVEQVKKCIMLK